MQNTADFWVGDRIVRPSLGEIQLGIERIHLEPRSMEVLVALAQRAPEVAPKQELIEAVWGDAFVSDEVLTHAIWDLRRAFGDQAANPEFIQTIPKRGYRLIAPVQEFAKAGEAVATPVSAIASRPLLFGVFGVLAIAAAIALWMAATGSEQRAWTEQLSRLLSTKLEETKGAEVSVVSLGGCDAASGVENEYCVEPILIPHGDGYQARTRLRKMDSPKLIYTTPPVPLQSRDQLDNAADGFVDQLQTALDVLGNPDIEHPDNWPWISLRKHKIEAIRAFLNSSAYVNRHEPGGRHPLDIASEIDPNFIVPRVWRTPTIVAEADQETLDAHRQELERLYAGASEFEAPMILWAIALIDRDPKAQLLQLRIAHEMEPGNRQVRMALAGTAFGFGNFEEAWNAVEPILDDKWCHSGLYPLAAVSALERGMIDDARSALEPSLQCDAVAPESHALLELLALYDGDAARREEHRRNLEARMKEVSRGLQVDVSALAELLAVRAQTDGHQKVAARLREFAI